MNKNEFDYEEPWHGRVEAGTGFPPNDIEGDSFVRALIGEYGIVFTTSVEAYYIFNGSEGLVEISVRKITDAL